MTDSIPKWTVEATSLFDSEIDPPDNPINVVREEDYERQRQATRRAQEDYDNLAGYFRRVVAALQECCKPEPDGIGGFVADEFTEQEVLDGRKLLEELKAKGLIK